MQGKTIHHYKVLEELGRGGMGVVYKAEDTKLKRTVALKFLPPNILASDEEKARFIHEAQAAAALHHPNICTIYEINEAEGQTFISIAYLEGFCLSEKLKEGPMDALEVTRIAVQITRGLQAAHEKGIIHRDIKSSNIMITEDGRATIMDFGLAKSARQTYKTQQDTKVGTIAYMSPEQTRGENVDFRTDIWSLGVLMYEMVTGQRPFRGDYDEAVIYSILNEEPIPISDHVSDVPPVLDAIIQKAMAKKPADRYETTAEMVENLNDIYEELRFDTTSSRRGSRLSSIRRGKEPVAKSLFAPRVLLVLAVYLIAAGGGFKTVEWAANRFVLSPHLTTVVLVGLLSLIPSVWILAARKTGEAPLWSKLTRIGVPANVLVSLILLYALFYGRDIGAATKTVTVQDETGTTIERVIPKREFRKSLALYFLDNKTDNSDYEWITGALAMLIEIDLYQDPFIHQRSSIDEAARQKLQEAGFSKWSEAPWNLKRKIADDAHVDHLLTGSFALEEDEWVVTMQLHESKSARLVDTKSYREKNLFALVDQATVDIRKDLGIPEGHIEANPDLPVSEMVTASMPALEQFCIGVHSLLAQDWPGSVEYLERAVELDSTFAYGYFVLFQVSRATNNIDRANEAIQLAMQHLYKLPERVQFVMKANYYSHTGDADKLLALGQMMVELRPDDIDARTILAAVRLQRYESELAIEQYKQILEIDPSRTEFLQTIASNYRGMGQFDLAAHYYELYLEKHPNDADAYHAFGMLYDVQGNYEKAKELYAKAIIIEPNNVSVLVDIGDIDEKLGKDKSALDNYNQALALAKTSQDRIRTYESIRNFYSNRGQMEKTIEQLQLLWAEQEKSAPPVSAQLMKLEDLCLFVRAGREKEAVDIIGTIEKALSPPLDQLVHYGQLCIYSELEDQDKAADALANLKTAIDTYKWERIRDEAWTYEGNIEEFRGNYEAAIRCYEEALKLNPTDYVVHRKIGRCYRKLEQNDEAISSLNKMIKIYPNDPATHYELALVYKKMGNQTRAMEHLKKALDWWENADPEFNPAKKARATLAEWESSE